MYVLIVEPDASGHHMSPYVQFMVRGAVRRGWKIRLLTTRTSSEHPALKIVENEVEGKLAISFMPEIPRFNGTSIMSLFLYQIKYYRAMARGFRALPADETPDLVYVMFIDAVDKALAVFGSPFGTVPFSGMFIAIKYHRFLMDIGPASRHDKLYKMLFERLLRIKSLYSLNVIDELFIEYSQQQSAPEYAKVKFVPDPGELEGFESDTQARKQLAIPADRFVILVYGSLSSRKGIKELLQAVSLLKDDTDSSISVLLAGKTNEEINHLLNQPIAEELTARGRLIVFSGFQDVEQEYRLFKSADAVWLGYVGNFYGKSAIIPQAGSVGLPILASKNGLIGKIVENNNLGLVFDPNDAYAVAKEIKRLQSNKRLQKRLGENGKRFAKQATAEEFGNKLCASIDIRQKIK